MAIYLLLVIVALCILLIVYIKRKTQKEYENLKEGDPILVYDRKTGNHYNCVVIISENKKCYMDAYTGYITEFTANDLFRGDVSLDRD